MPRSRMVGERGWLRLYSEAHVFGAAVGLLMRGVRVNVPIRSREQFASRLTLALGSIKYHLTGAAANCYQFSPREGRLFVGLFTISVYLRSSFAIVVGPAWCVNKVRKKLR